MPTEEEHRLPEWAAALRRRFRFEALLGQGSHGQVYRARARLGPEPDAALGPPLALKLLPLDAPEEDRRRLTNEQGAVARLEHPHVVRLHEAIADEDGLAVALVLELVDGPTLEDLLALGALGPTACAKALADVAEALAAAHAAGVVHRDLKPANVLLDAELRPRVVDFGFALHPGAERLTAAGVALGTPAYMAPEVLRDGAAAAGPAADVWALGVMLAEGVGGAHPFLAPSWEEMAARIACGDATPPPAAAPPLLVEACRAALTLEPAQRPTARELARLLRLAVEEAAPASEPASRAGSEPAPRPGSRPDSDPAAQAGQEAPAQPGPAPELGRAGTRVGTCLGPYELVSALGRGAMGVVFLGRHRETGAEHALKVTRPLANAAQRRRFEREATLAARSRRIPGSSRSTPARRSPTGGPTSPWSGWRAPTWPACWPRADPSRRRAPCRSSPAWPRRSRTSTRPGWRIATSSRRTCSCAPATSR